MGPLSEYLVPLAALLVGFYLGAASGAPQAREVAYWSPACSLMSVWRDDALARPWESVGQALW